MQGRRQSSQCRAGNATQGRQRNAGPSTQRRAVVSIQGRRLNRRPFSQCRACQFHAGASAQCSAVSSMQRRQLSAAPSAQCRCRLFQCRHVCFNAGPVCFNAGRSVSMQGCLLNAARSVCSTRGPSAQRNAFLLNARPVRSMQSVREVVSWRQDRQLSARLFVSMEGLLNARPSLQCRVISSTQGRHLNAGAFGWLDHDLLTEFSSEKKPTPWCLFFFEEAYSGSTLFFLDNP